MDTHWRLILDGRLDGPTNMAVDQAIFRSVEAGASPPTLRFYGWTPPTISLGYAQDMGVLDLERCLSSGVGIVKRPTGGKAVFHDKEVTYSLSCPIPSGYFPDTLRGSCLAINTCIVQGLARLGPGWGFEVLPGFRERTKVACFEGPSGHEITGGGKKIVGSAQRRRDRAFLQHGSIPLVIRWDALRRYFRDECLPDRPHAAGLCEYLGRDIGEDEVIDAIVKSFTSALGIGFDRGELSGEEKGIVPALREAFTLTPMSKGRIIVWAYGR